jgi:hypothetical protein
MAYTTNWQVADLGGGGHQPIGETSSTAKHPLGTRVKAIDRGTNQNGEGDFIYVKGVASAVRGSFVLISEDDYTTSLLAANDIGRVGILMSALTAGLYGWAQIRGKAVGKVLAAFADNANVYSTATAGSVDDAVVAGDRLKQCKGASAIDIPETGMAEFEIDNPFVDDALAA